MERFRRESWIWLLALYTAAGFIEVVFWSQVSAFTPLYLPKLGVAPGDVSAWTGYIATISTLVGIPLLPFWGALADRYARQPIIIRSFVAHLLAGVLAMLAGNVWVFLLARAMQSFALGNSGLMMTTLSERTPTNRVGLAFSIMNAAPPMGLFVGPLVGGRVIDAYGFPTLLAIDAVLMVVVIVALTFGYVDHFKGRKEGSMLRMTLESVNIIGRSPRLRTLLPALFLLFAGWMMAFTYVPLVVTSIYSGSDQATVVGWVMGVGGLVTLFLTPVLGSLADKYGHWHVLFASSALSVLLWPVPFFTRDLPAFGIAWAVLNGVTSGTFSISFSVLAASAHSNVRGRVMTFAYLPVNMGYAVGPAIGSALTAMRVPGALFYIFPAAAVVTALGIGLLWAAYRQPVSPAAPRSAEAAPTKIA